MHKEDIEFLKLAIVEAKKALSNDDIPIGAIIVYNENKNNKKMFEKMSSLGIGDFTIIGKGYNRRNKDKDVTSHAEILAIREACKRISDFRLEDCTMYVTLEPCQMCAGAIVQARMKRLVIGTKSFKAGSCGSIIDILNNDSFNHKVSVDFLDDEESKNLITEYFKGLRSK